MAPTTRSSKRRIADTSLATPEPHGQTAAVPQGDAYNEQSDEEQSDAETEAEPAKKRARRTRKEKDDYRPPKQTKVKGKLQIFKNLPVEVFIGIAKYLHPFDLVLLSRVNKFFRELFMSRQATSIWISARLNVPGLPPCPPELCEPQYAALIFTKMCSYCGKYAPRHMDSILLVRLCSSCRDRQYKLIPAIRERIFDLSLLPQSRELIPRNFRPYGWLCLSSDADAVESKLNELEATGDEEALARWKVERRKAVQDRDANAEHFRSWFAARDQERGIELVQQKDAHQVEVESRLISIGWEQQDHCAIDHRRRKQWLSLVRSPKVLTDRAWDKLLPQLLVHLEANKKERLERECRARRNERDSAFQEFWSRLRQESPPLLQLAQEQLDSEEPSPSSAKPELHSLCRVFPSSYKARDWPEYDKLINEDIPGSEMKLRLLENQDCFNEFVQKWATQLEEMLIERVPDHVLPPDFNIPGYSLTANTNPADTIFPGIQMLLRADVIFKRGEYGDISYYPDDFSDLPHSSRLYYDTEWSSIATDLLHALGRPDATYLEMQLLGYNFQCGRCNANSGTMGWKSMVRHYSSQKSTWLERSQRSSVRSAQDFVYLFTHDTKVENAKPLVRILSKSDISASSHYSYSPGSQCLVCNSVGLIESYPEANMKDHLRDVHSIEEPEKGKHYS